MISTIVKLVIVFILAFFYVNKITHIILTSDMNHVIK